MIVKNQMGVCHKTVTIVAYSYRMDFSDCIVESQVVPAAESGLGKELHYYLIRYRDGCLAGDCHVSNLMRSCLKNRADAFKNRWPGYYEANTFRSCEMNADTYFSLLVDENQEVVAGARAIFSNNQKTLPYYSNYENHQLDDVFDGISNGGRPLSFCEYGGAFTRTDYVRDNGLSKLNAEYLYKFINSKNPDIIFVDAFADLLNKYLGWAKRFGMQQMYMAPSNSDPLGMLMIQTPHGEAKLDLAGCCLDNGVSLVDGLSERSSARFVAESLVKRAVERQHRAEGTISGDGMQGWAGQFQIHSGSGRCI